MTRPLLERSSYKPSAVDANTAPSVPTNRYCFIFEGNLWTITVISTNWPAPPILPPQLSQLQAN